MLNAYINREELCKTLEKELSYNTKYSKDSIYSSYSKIDTDEMKNISNIFSIKDLKENMSMMMKTYNYSIYIVIAFAAVMALIIISVIANIVVEENKKTISLMKVMGYKNMEISSIVLNIYTPFVVIAYLLSIPAMIALLKYIVSLLTKNIDFAIPIGLSYDKALIGLVALLIGYYVAIILSRKALNKVPLAVALKRE
jgi:putative ABC transport system permease protein